MPQFDTTTKQLRDGVKSTTVSAAVKTIKGWEARAFLQNARLTQAEKAAIGSGNWERLTRPLSAPQSS